MGLPGIEAADNAAKDAAMSGYLITYWVIGDGVCSFLHCVIYSSWQADWSNIVHNKLRDIKPTHYVYVCVCVRACHLSAQYGERR